MNNNDAGVIQVLLDRFNKQCLPRALAMKARVDVGHTLQTFEVNFLANVLADVHSIRVLVERHTEYEVLVLKAIDMYKEITEKALINETTNRSNHLAYSNMKGNTHREEMCCDGNGL